MKQAITTLFAFGVVAEASFMSGVTQKLTQAAETTEVEDFLAEEFVDETIDATVDAVEEVVAVSEEVSTYDDELREARIELEALNRTSSINFWIIFVFLNASPYIPVGSSFFYIGIWGLLWLATVLTKTSFSGRVYDNATVRVDEEYYSGDVEL